MIMVIGNKYDLVQDNDDKRKVTRKEAEDFAKKCGLMYSETSAKTGHNVKEAFEDFIESIVSIIEQFISLLAIHEAQKNYNEDEIRQHEEDKLKIRLTKNFGNPEGEADAQPPKQDCCCSQIAKRNHFRSDNLI